jgi:hypothetical protein
MECGGREFLMAAFLLMVSLISLITLPMPSVLLLFGKRGGVKFGGRESELCIAEIFLIEPPK